MQACYKTTNALRNYVLVHMPPLTDTTAESVAVEGKWRLMLKRDSLYLVISFWSEYVKIFHEDIETTFIILKQSIRLSTALQMPYIRL